MILFLVYSYIGHPMNFNFDDILHINVRVAGSLSVTLELIDLVTHGIPHC